MSHRARFAATMLTWIIAILALALSQLVPPAARPADAPAREFSALRAMEHVRVIAQAPHPSGSPEIETVRQYLIAQLAAHGLSPETPDDRIILQNSGTGERTIVRNLCAVITGTASTGTIVVMAHYDSVPGASYMFVWPLLAGTLAHGAALLAGWRRDSWARQFVFALAAVPVLLLWGISIALLFLSTATFFLPALVSLVVLVMGALAAQGDTLLSWDGSRRADGGRAKPGDMSDDG